MKNNVKSSVSYMSSTLIFYNITMINIQIGLGESKFKRVEFDEDVHSIFCEWDNQTLKHEDATSLA